MTFDDITGDGRLWAIKLTRTMQEREHTLPELNQLEQVRNFLISEGAFDIDGFYDLMHR